MKFLLAPATQTVLQFSDPADFFESADGSLFNYQVTFLEDEMVTIEDTLGRYLPLDIEEVDDLIEVLLRISKFQKWKAVMQAALFEELTSGADFPV